MIRPVPSFVLPGMFYAIDRYMRSRHSDYANFVIAQPLDEPRSSLAALRDALFPVARNAHTWICEENWHPLGVAQARARPGNLAWDLTFLAAMTRRDDQPAPAAAQDEALLEMVQYALNAAIMRGVHRVFARVEDERPELEIFGKLGFQRYARELTYWLPSAADGLDALARLDTLAASDPPDAERASAGANSRGAGASVPLRPWHRHDAWGLLRLYDACTPKVVQLAESLTNDELIHTRAAGGRTWYLPLLEPETSAFVHDRGARLGGWLRLRHGRGSPPHMLSLLAHPDDPGVAPALLRFGLRVLAQDGPRPVYCQAREYETATVDALRAAGFAHTGTDALLVRHLTMRALRGREVPAVEARMAYGVRGYGTTPSRLSKGENTQYARTETH